MSDILYFEDNLKKAEDIENSIVDTIAEDVKIIENAETENLKTEESAAEVAGEEKKEETIEPAAEQEEETEEPAAEQEEETEEPAADESGEGEAASEEEPEEKKTFFKQVSEYGEKIREGAVKAGNAVKEQTVKAGEQIKDASKKVGHKNAETEEEETEPETTEETSVGTVRIADDVVAMIAMYASQEVEGVAGMAESNTREWLGKVGIKDPMKGVRVEVNEKNVRVDLQIIMGYGYNIPATSSKVQARVKQAIENMTGLNVTDVNVRIAGITVSNDSSEN